MKKKVKTQSIKLCNCPIIGGMSEGVICARDNGKKSKNKGRCIIKT